MASPPRFVALDSLRGVAALGVAAYHLHGGGVLFDNAFIDNAWVLVDFFFVLSGFVIAANYGERLGRGFALTRFMLLRLGRLYPLHLFVLALYVLLELGQLLLAPPGMTMREPFAGQHSPGHLLLTVLMLQGFSLDSTMGWNAQSWSISVELWLYLAMALAWRGLGRRAWIVAGLAALAGLAAFALGYRGLTEPLTFGLLRGVIGFGIGVVAWSEVALLAATGAAIVWLPPFEWRHALLDPLFALLVLTFAAERGAVSRVLRTAPFVLCGTLSYSIYLIHLMVQGRGIDLLRLVGLGSLGFNGVAPVRAIAAPPGWDSLIGLTLLAATVGTAWFTWKFIEMPAREWSRRRLHASAD
jgi:peptidoglycan/LPS O-acetylase OafA/YrhL